MFKHILVPVDGSSTAQAAFGKAAELAKAFDGMVTVLYVIDPYPFTGVGTGFAYGQNEYLSAANAEAEAIVRAAKDSLSVSGVKVDTSFVEAHTIWRGIVAAADSLQADLIVIGSHGRSGLEKLMLGSVAHAVLSHARQPVLVVRE